MRDLGVDERARCAFLRTFGSNAPEPMRGKEAIRAYAQGWFTAFPDLKLTTLNRLVDGDQIAAELESRGTNTGPMNIGGMEIPPTEKAVVRHGAYFARASDGKIIEFIAHPTPQA